MWDYPASPTVGQTYQRYTWDGEKWVGSGGVPVVTDGDKGDVVVSGGGAAWLLDPDVVTTQARSLLDDATTPEMRTTLDLGNVADLSPAQLAAPGNAVGDALLDKVDVAYTATAPQACLRTVQDRLTTLIDASDFGVYPGSSASANRSGLLWARDALPASGGRILLPASQPYLVDPDIDLGGKAVSLEGRGAQLTKLVQTSPGNGLRFTLSDPAHVAQIRGLSLMTTAVDVGTGLTVEYTVDGFAGRLGRRLLVEDVEIQGFDYTTQGWAQLGSLVNINGSTWDKVWLSGRSTNGTAGYEEADNTITPFGLVFTGTMYPTDHVFYTLHAWGLDTVVKIRGAAEGIISIGHVFVNVGTGFDWAPDVGYGGRPQIALVSGHANVYKTVMKLSAVQQVTVIRGEYYHNPGATSAGVMFDLNHVQDGHIATFIGKYSAAGVPVCGIQASGTQTTNLVIDGCNLGGTYTQLDTGIAIANGTPGVIIGPSNIYNCVVSVDDANPGHGLAITRYGTPRATYTKSANQACPDSVETAIEFDTPVEDFLGLAAGDSFVIAAGTHVVRVTATVLLQSGSGGAILSLKKNGAAVPRSLRSDVLYKGGYSPTLSTEVIVDVAAGDALEVVLQHNQGAPMMAQGSGYTSITIERLG